MAASTLSSTRSAPLGAVAEEGGIEIVGSRPGALPIRKMLAQTTARRNPSVTPHATQYFKTVLLPDGRAITSFHVAGVDGEAGQPRTPDPAVATGSWNSTARQDFTERLYMHPEDRGNTARYGNSEEPWVTTKLRQRELGIVPNARGKTDRFYRDRHTRPHTTPAALTIWDRQQGQDGSPEPPAIAQKGYKATVPAAPAVVATAAATSRSAESDLETDVRIILTSSTDAASTISSWMQNASLFEREVAKRFLHDIALRCSNRPVSRAHRSPSPQQL